MNAFANFLDQCDLKQLVKPKFAERWSCDKLIENEKVPKQTKCEIVCSKGYDILKGTLWSNCMS